MARGQVKEHSYETIILESHLDTLGHVNNAVYLELFEEARWDFITRGGYGLKEVQERKQGPIILEVNVRFSRELHLRDKIKITSKLVSLTGKIGKLEQIVYNGAGEESAKALFTMGFFDLKARKLIAPTPEWLKAGGWDKL
ncbi:acyl-CoA thioesterase [bacterium]|nr:acyl-CoA thioesterase [bacterium]